MKSSIMSICLLGAIIAASYALDEDTVVPETQFEEATVLPVDNDENNDDTLVLTDALVATGTRSTFHKAFKKHTKWVPNYRRRNTTRRRYGHPPPVPAPAPAPPPP